MNRGPLKTRKETDFAGKAELAWGTPPDWVVALVEACAASSQTAVAARIGYSAATVSQCIGNTYRGDIDRVAEKVRGALLKMQVACPILGDIGRDRCLDEQKEPFRATSAMRAQLYHACRSGCPFSNITKDVPHA